MNLSFLKSGNHISWIRRVSREHLSDLVCIYFLDFVCIDHGSGAIFTLIVKLPWSVEVSILNLFGMFRTKFFNRPVDESFFDDWIRSMLVSSFGLSRNKSIVSTKWWLVSLRSLVLGDECLGVSWAADVGSVCLLNVLSHLNIIIS